MAFLDSLKEYLEEILHRPPRANGSGPLMIDAANARSQLIRCLERLEQQEQTSGNEVRVDRYDSLLKRWQAGDRVVRFARRIAQLLLEGMSKGASTLELEHLIEVAIARRLGLPDTLPSLIRTLELDRLASNAYAEVFTPYQDTVPIEVDAYAAAIRATRKTGTSITLTPVGRIFLEFTGRDAIRWLLHVEVAQSTGRWDPWMVSRQTAHALVRKTKWTFGADEHVYDRAPGSWSTLKRLKALGLVSMTSDDDRQEDDLETLPLGLELLREVESKAESPMSILADSLLADLTLSAAEVVSRPPSEDAGARASTAEATARLARLVAHEIRNALVPVKTSVGALYREILLNSSSETLSRRREGIDRGIDTIFRFIDQLAKISALAAKPPESFDPLAAIRDAVATVEAESGKRVEQDLPATLPPVSGHRDRVVMALINVLRNATQAVTDASPVIRISAESVENASAVLLTIDDNGPGVPENMRQAIFNEGTSLTPGGSGMGLALVREVFEKEMKGLVGCHDSPLGGARFVIRMTSTGKE